MSKILTIFLAITSTVPLWAMDETSPTQKIHYIALAELDNLDKNIEILTIVREKTKRFQKSNFSEVSPTPSLDRREPSCCDNCPNDLDDPSVKVFSALCAWSFPLVIYPMCICLAIVGTTIYLITKTTQNQTRIL